MLFESQARRRLSYTRMAPLVSLLLATALISIVVKAEETHSLEKFDPSAAQLHPSVWKKEIHQCLQF